MSDVENQNAISRENIEGTIKDLLQKEQINDCIILVIFESHQFKTGNNTARKILERLKIIDKDCNLTIDDISIAIEELIDNGFLDIAELPN